MNKQSTLFKPIKVKDLKCNQNLLVWLYISKDIWSVLDISPIFFPEEYGGFSPPLRSEPQTSTWRDGCQPRYELPTIYCCSFILLNKHNTVFKLQTYKRYGSEAHILQRIFVTRKCSWHLTFFIFLKNMVVFSPPLRFEPKTFTRRDGCQPRYWLLATFNLLIANSVGLCPYLGLLVYWLKAKCSPYRNLFLSF